MIAIPYRVYPGLGVPVGLAVVGILGKKLTRGAGGGWCSSDFYLGVEFTLAAVSAALLNLFDFLKPNRPLQASDTKVLLANFLVAFIGMILFIFVLSLHQDYQGNPKKSQRRQLVVLAGVANMLGFLILAIGVILMPNS